MSKPLVTLTDLLLVILISVISIISMTAYQKINNIEPSLEGLSQIESKADALISKMESRLDLINKYEPLLDGIKRRCDEINCTDDLMELLDNKTVTCK